MRLLDRSDKLLTIFGSRTFCYSAAIVFMAIANAPLVTVLIYHSGSEHLGYLIGEAPGKFLFSLLMYPIIAILIFSALHAFANDPALSSTTFGRLSLSFAWLVLGVAVANVVTLIDYRTTSPALYAIVRPYADLGAAAHSTLLKNLPPVHTKDIEELENDSEREDWEKWEQIRNAGASDDLSSVDSANLDSSGAAGVLAVLFDKSAAIERRLLARSIAISDWLQMCVVLLTAWYGVWMISTLFVHHEINSSGSRTVYTLALSYLLVWLSFPVLRNYTDTENASISVHFTTIRGAGIAFMLIIISVAYLLLRNTISNLWSVVRFLAPPVSVAAGIFSFQVISISSARQYIGVEAGVGKFALLSIVIVIAMVPWTARVLKGDLKLLPPSAGATEGPGN